MTPDLIQLPSQPNQSRLACLLGQLAGLACALGLVLLHSGGDFSELTADLDAPVLSVLAVWLLSIILFVWRGSARLSARPLMAVWFGLPPVVVGLFFSCLTIGQLPLGPDQKENCDLLMLIAFMAERTSMAGLLGAGSIWLGALVSLGKICMSRGQRAERRPWWAYWTAALMIVAGLAWTFLDPLLPARAQVGGFAVKGLWILFSAVLALAFWAEVVGRTKSADQKVALAVTVLLGLVVMGLALVSYHRLVGFYSLAYSSTSLYLDGRFLTGLVTATALVRTSPFLVGVLIVTFVIALRLADSSQRRRVVALGLALLALIGLRFGYEFGFRSGHQERCRMKFPASLDLPVAQTLEEVGQDPVLTLAGTRAWYDGELLDISKEAKTEFPKPASAKNAVLRLAVGKQLNFDRLYSYLTSAARSGWCRFRLIAQKDFGQQDPCLIDQRLFGVCLQSRFGEIPIEVPCLGHNVYGLGEEQPPGPALTANLIIEPDRMELTFGGFGHSVEFLDSLSKVIPDRFGVRDLEGLRVVFGEVKTKQSGGQTVILLPHQALTVSELVPILDIIKASQNENQASQIVISQLIR
jgi:hypothetical protein